MKIPLYIRKSIYSALAFFGTLLILSAGYATYTALSPVIAGQPLTKDIWNQMILNLTDHETRIANIESGAGVKKINGTWGSASIGISNATNTYIWDAITLTPGNWVVYYSTFYDRDSVAAFGINTYNHPHLSTTTDISGWVSSGNLEICGQDYCPIHQTYQVNVASTATYYIIHYINWHAGTAYLRSGWGNFYALKVN